MLPRGFGVVLPPGVGAPAGTERKLGILGGLDAAKSATLGGLGEGSESSGEDISKDHPATLPASTYVCVDVPIDMESYHHHQHLR